METEDSQNADKIIGDCTLLLGDCLERMKEIPDKSIDAIICDYDSGFSLRRIAITYKTNHNKIKRILLSRGIELRKPKHMRGVRKYETLKHSKYANMKNHLRFDVTLEWLIQFDFDKLKVLNGAITNRDNRWDISTDEYIKYIEHFYSDTQFEVVYNKYICNKCKYLKPSLDHIIPKSKGGSNEIENLQFLSWFENRCKNDMAQDEWDNIKANIKEYLV